MLVLTRRVGEVLMIGEDVKITVLSSKGNQVRIGVSAPKEIAVHREEIFNKIQYQRKNTSTHKRNNEICERSVSDEKNE